jgi:hypothetical protein
MSPLSATISRVNKQHYEELLHPATATGMCRLATLPFGRCNK